MIKYELSDGRIVEFDENDDNAKKTFEEKLKAKNLTAKVITDELGKKSGADQPQITEVNQPQNNQQKDTELPSVDISSESQSTEVKPTVTEPAKIEAPKPILKFGATGPYYEDPVSGDIINKENLNEEQQVKIKDTEENLKKVSENYEDIPLEDKEAITTFGFRGMPITKEGVKKTIDAGTNTANQVVNVVSSLKDPQERAKLKTWSKNVINNIPENAYSWMLSGMAVSRDVFSMDLDGIVSEKEAKVREEQEDKIIKLYSDIEKIDKGEEIEGPFDTKLKIKDTGPGVVEGFKSGSGAAVFSGLFRNFTGVVETAIPALVTSGFSLPVQIAAPFYTSYNQEKAKTLYGDDPDAVQKLYENNEAERVKPLGIGMLATGLEGLGLKGLYKFIKGKPTSGSRAFDLFATSSLEGSVELGQGAFETVNRSLASGDSIEQASIKAWKWMNSDDGLENFIAGFTGAGQVGVVGSAGRKLRRSLISDDATLGDIKNRVDNLSKLNQIKNTTKDPDAKAAVDLEIKAAEKDLKNYVNNKTKINKILTNDQKTELVNILDKKDDINSKINTLKDKLDNNEISRKEHGYALRSLNNEKKRLSNQLNDVKNQALQDAAKRTTETVKEQIKQAGLEGEVKEMTAQEISEMDLGENVDSKKASGEFGFVRQFADGSFEIVVNIDKPAEGTASHEFQHVVLNKTLKGETQNILARELKKHVSTLEGEGVENLNQRLQEYKDDADLGEETITIMSESILDGSLKYNEGFFTKIGDIIRRFLQDTGLKKVRFDTGRDVYNFIKDYNKSIQKGNLSKAIINVAREGAKGKLVDDAGATTETGIKRSIATKKMSEDIDQHVPKNITTNEQYLTKDTKTRLSPHDNVLIEILNKNTLDGYLSNLITRDKRLGGVTDTQTLLEDTKFELLRKIRSEYKPTLEDGSFRSLFSYIYGKKEQGGYGGIAVRALGNMKKKYLQRPDAGAAPIDISTPEGKVTRQIADTKEETSFDTQDLSIPKQAKEARQTKQQGQSLEAEIEGKLVSEELNFTKETNDKINNEINKVNYDTNKPYESVKEDMMSQQDPNTDVRTRVKPTGTLFKAFDTIAKEVFGVDARSTMARKQTLDKSENVSARKVIADGAKKNKSIKKFLEDILPDTNFNPKSKKSLGTWAGLIRSLYEPVLKDGKPIRYNNIAARRLNLDKFTEAEVADMFGLTPDYNLLPYKKGFKDGMIKGVVVGAAGLSINQSIRKIADAPASPISIGKPKTMFSKTVKAKNLGQVDIKFSRENGDVLVAKNLGQKHPKITMENATQFVDDMVKIVKNFDAMVGPGFITKNVAITSSTIPGRSGNLGHKTRKYAKAELDKKVTFQKDEQFARNKISTKYVRRLQAKGQKIFKQEIDKANKKNVGNFTKMWKAIHNMVQSDPSLISPLLHWLKGSQNEGSHPHRIGAAFEYIDKTIKGDLYFEHALQNATSYRLLMNAAGNIKDPKQFNEFLDAVKRNYKLIAISATDNTKIDKAGYKNLMAIDIVDGKKVAGKWNVFENNWWERYFNELMADIDGGINVDNLVNIQTDTSIAEDFNINSNGSIRFSKPSTEIKAAKNLSNAVSNRIKFSKTGKTRGLSVFDFDDTLGFTKSGVRATVPNADGTPKPNRKVVFLAGGAGSGKGNVIKKLGLSEQGFKIVNSDISLEWLKKNSGLPADMRDLTKEQRSTLGKLGAQARKIARGKMMKYQGNADGVVVDGTGGSTKTMQKLVDEFKDKGYDISMLFVDTSLDVALERNRARKERSLLDVIVKRNHEAVQNNKSTFQSMFGDRFMEVNTDKLTQDSAMPNNLVKQMDDFVSGYEKRRLDAAEFAEQGASILEQGGKFDFSEFNNVVDGTPGPLLDKAKERSKKFGSKDIFVLTARPAASAGPIQQFLKSQGLEVPLKNITGLANSSANAKAEWFIQKYAEGYNDMYFADDALQNVEAVKQVLNQLDVKSNVVQAKIKFSKNASKELNDMIERKKGIGSEKVFSGAEARARGRDIGKYDFYIPPSAEDFKGLLYYFMGKGKRGDADAKFLGNHLLKPFAKGIRTWNTYKQNMADDFRRLKKQNPKVVKKLNNKVEGTSFTNDTAIRVYLWDKAGKEIPNISSSLQTRLVNHVNNNIDLKQFADAVSTITKISEGYTTPGQNWVVGSIARDLSDTVNKVGRKQFLAEWIDNKDQIFTTENLNKIEAAYGTRYREALENILFRMENGGNRVVSKDRDVNFMVNWINGAVGSIMFFNMRSALLQTISSVNFINFSDNNIFKASKAFANQPQFWKDFSMLFNSDQLKQRRKGLQTDVSSSELVKSFKENGASYQAVVNFLLEKGFLPTQIADSTAIAFGGASFYRNRYNKYKKQGMTDTKAKEQAMLDFQEIAEETQQSSREDLVSKQQASVLGRIVLAFQNVTMQYGRLTKKALSDLVNRRGDTKTNISKILYYGAVQNIVFASLQSALAFMMFGEDEEEIEEKKVRVANNVLDSFLRGTGIYGALASTLKNTAVQWHIQSQKAKEGFRRDDVMKIAQEAINLSPPIGSKVRKIVSAYRQKSFAKSVGDNLKYRLENPMLGVGSNIIEGVTNIPLARLLNKANNLEEAITSDHETWKRVAMVLGWSRWELGLQDEEVEAAREKVKVEKKVEREEKKKIKKEEEKKKKEEQKKKEEEEKKKKGIKTVRCSGIRSNGTRCKLTTETAAKKFLCVHHKPFKDGSDTDGDGKKEYRCIATKANGKRCKNKTENKNKKCYAHQ